jgi:methylmalonyl-CoA mutase cobalamin-binding domain/chain
LALRLYEWTLRELGEYRTALDVVIRLERLTGQSGRELYAFAERARTEGALDVALDAYRALQTLNVPIDIRTMALFGRAQAIEQRMLSSRIKSQNELEQLKKEYETIAREFPTHPLAATALLRIAQLERIKSERNAEEVSRALEQLENAARNERENLMPYAIAAARARATVGEITQALEAVFGRYQAAPTAIAGIFRSSYGHDETFKQLHARVLRFEQRTGRRPRILIAKLGQDGHDRGSKVIASGFADLGFDVDLGPLFQTPEEVARQAIENDVHIVGISTQAGAHKTLIPELIERLRAQGAEDILVVAGGIIPPKDYDALYREGVHAIFGPGTPVLNAAATVLNLLEHHWNVCDAEHQ